MKPPRVLVLGPLLGVQLGNLLDEGVPDYLDAVYSDSHSVDALLEALATFLPPPGLGVIDDALRDKVAQVLASEAAEAQSESDASPPSLMALSPSTVSTSLASSAQDRSKADPVRSQSSGPSLAGGDEEEECHSGSGEAKALPAEVVSALAILKGLQPSLDDDVVYFVLMDLCKGNMDEAAERILENTQSVVARFKERKAAEKRDADAERRARQRVVEKFDLRPDPSGVKTTLTSSAPAKKTEKESGIRYLDGKVVSTKGERFIVQETKPDWDGGSRGRVKTKGKRGPGFVSG